MVLDGEYGGFKVYQGIEGRPWFNFTLPLYQKRFSWATPDLEIVDANADGFADIYVVQVDEFKSKESYCSLHTPNNGTRMYILFSFVACSAQYFVLTGVFLYLQNIPLTGFPPWILQMMCYYWELDWARSSQ
jgi:hypothetical protein